MLLIEDEAKKRWCPFARILESDGHEIRCGEEPVPVSASVNRRSAGQGVGGREYPFLPGSCRCVASACMAWRWEDRREPGQEDRGYCGLAGEV